MKRQIISGIGWTTTGRILKEAIQFVVGVLLARLLAPDDFGLMAMALVFARLAWRFSDLGFAGAIVQRRTITEAHLSSIFWLNIVAGLVITLLLIAAAPLIAAFYNAPDLVPIIVVIASTIAIGALNDVQMALMRRNMLFHQQAIANATAFGVSGAVAVGLALAGFGVWSLVAQTVVMMVANVSVMWYLSDWTPKLLFDVQAVREVLGFSVNLAGFKVTEYLVQNTDNLLIGRFVDVYALGIYQIAYKYMLIPANLIAPVFGTVLVSGLSRVQDDPARLRLIYLKINQVLVFLALPLSAGLIVVADSFVLALLGAKWADAIPLLRVMGVAALWLPLFQSRSWLLIALGRTDVLLRWQAIEGVLAVIFLLIGVQFGIEGVAVAFVARTFLLAYPLLAIPGALIDLSFGAYMRKLLPILLVGLAMALSVWLASVTLLGGLSPLPRLALQVALGGAVYAGLALGLRLEVVRELLRVLREMIAERGSAGEQDSAPIEQV